MPICFKCKSSIKPASLATTVQGQTYHPTCITCGICQTAIWGKPFKREKNGMITCEKACVPAPAPKVLPNIAVASPRPPSTNTPFTQRESRPSSARSDLSKLISQSQLFTSGSITNLSSINLNSNKLCKLCYKSVQNKRFITYENGDILCFECNEILVNANKRPPRVPSAHLIVCAVCNQTVRGTKFITEPSGEIVCENCDSKDGIRCLKCNQLFKTNSLSDDKITLVTGKSYHYTCFNCSQCNININRGSYYLNNDTGQPICLNCYDMTQLPKCSLCNNFIATDQYVIIDNKPLHSQCFRCINCNSILSSLENGAGFTKDSNDQYICYNCNVVNNSVRCAKCMNLVPKDVGNGISFGFNDYHVECFKCDQCKVNLTKMNKTYTDNNNQGLLFCEKCFSENYLPKCTKCVQPIMPQSPGIRYEEKMYHKECLLCGRCKKSLADKKFYKSGNLLVCDSCF